MEYFSPVPLSSAGRPIPLEEEVDIRNIDQVSVHVQNDRTVMNDLFQNVILILTNFRMILVQSTVQKTLIAWGIHLKEVQGLEDCSTMWSRSKRIKVNFHIRKITYDIGLKFHAGEKEEFLELCQRVLLKKSWEKVIPKSVFLTPQIAHPNTTTTTTTSTIPTTSSSSVTVASSSGAGMTTSMPTSTSTTAPTSTFSTSNAGISGIIRKQEQQMQNVDALTKNALSDLDQLINQARDVVQVIQRYATYMQESKALKDNGDEVSETTTQVAEANAMEEIMQSIGIVSPVTRLSAGRLYHEQLARQVTELLLHQHRLERLGGMITLTDLYCLYNKARGSELVSPNDFLCACEKMKSLNLGIQLRSFPSGVKVVELAHVDETVFTQRIVDYIKSNEDLVLNGISISNLALQFNLSLVIAKEKLLLAEKQQSLCRDESIRGLYFFLNSFPTL